MKKITADEIEVIDSQGKVLKESSHHVEEKESHFKINGIPFGKMGHFKVLKGGPLMLLMIPIIIPFILVGFFLLLVVALLFGRSAFKVIKR